MIAAISLLLNLTPPNAAPAQYNYAPLVTTQQVADVPLGVSVPLVAWAADLDGDPIDYRWRILARPTGSTAAIDAPENQATSLQPDIPGNYELSVTVSDGNHETVRSLEFSATGIPPSQNEKILRLGSVPTPTFADSSSTLPEFPEAPPTTGGLRPLSFRWSRPLRYADGSHLIAVAGFRVYRGPRPDASASCARYSHCLAHYATMRPVPPIPREGFPELLKPYYFIDWVPLSVPSCYSVTTIPVFGSESEWSNFIEIPPP
ncbi:MAG: hypothetical protein VX663_10390 [Pseudomonadota bacterium]|nr:hypothetical protein [Pseudomonadota bacterium]